MMTREKAVKMFGSLGALADFFDITKQAVNLWPADELIPHLREVLIREAQLKDKYLKKKRPHSLESQETPKGRFFSKPTSRNPSW
jgi:hypothetical protein